MLAEILLSHQGSPPARPNQSLPVESCSLSLRDLSLSHAHPHLLKNASPKWKMEVSLKDNPTTERGNKKGFAWLVQFADCRMNKAEKCQHNCGKPANQKHSWHAEPIRRPARKAEPDRQ